MDIQNNPDISASVTVPEAISQAFQTGMQLNLNREDIAFIAGLVTYLEVQQNHSLVMTDLETVYEIVNEVAQGNQESISQRSQGAVERLLKNRLLLRVDGGGISQLPHYDVTRLGKAIVDFLLDNEKLTRQNLAIITTQIIGVLAEIRAAMKSSGSDRFWEEQVQLPLKHVVGELLEALEKRQRGLDQEQEDVRAQIGSLLEKEWLEALETCENLLETTSQTLQELYRTLLAENTAIKQGLNEIYEAADDHYQIGVLNTIDAIYHRLDQLEQWGKERVSSWSQYYRRVNDFLQSIVQFDPNREFSQKLKEQLLDYPQAPWYLNVLEPPVYWAIRELALTTAKNRVVRALPEVLDDPEADDDDGNLVLDLMIDALKDRLIAGQSLDLIAVLTPFLKTYDLNRIYPHIGTLIDLMVLEGYEGAEMDLAMEWKQPLADLEFWLQNLTINQETKEDT